MSVYVGIDVHRKRSQVAVVAEDGEVQLNRNVVNGSGPMLRLIGGLPAGTPVASGAAFGWGWLAELLADGGFEAHLVHPLRCKAIASARLKNDKAGAAILAQLLRADLLPEAAAGVFMGPRRARAGPDRVHPLTRPVCVTRRRPQRSPATGQLPGARHPPRARTRTFSPRTPNTVLTT